MHILMPIPFTEEAVRHTAGRTRRAREEPQAPAHRIGKDFIPGAKPPEPTWLIVFRARLGEGGYLELNRQAAEIAARVRDNKAGRTGTELLADAGARLAFMNPAAALRDGLGILEALRQRDIILRAGPSG